MSAAAAESVARLEERPLAAPDPRDPVVLGRLRSLEREYVLRAQLGKLYDSFRAADAQISSRKGPPDVTQTVLQFVGWVVDT